MSPTVQPHNYELLSTPQELSSLCDYLRQARMFAFDTEFIGEDSYEPRLCLVQIATAERIELIDPIAIPDLSPLWQLIADPAIAKICHAGDQDLTIVFQRGGVTAANTFDAQIAAGLVGLGYPLAYWRVAELYTGISLAKAHTYSAWDRRPLSRDQLTYALDDVLHLPRIYETLSGKLQELGRMPWMEQMCGELCGSAATPLKPRTIYQRIKGASSLQPVQVLALQELCVWREQVAFEHNMPPRALMKDTTVLEIANRMPRKTTELATIRGIAPSELTTYGNDLLAAVNRARSVPPEQRPPIQPQTEDNLETKRLAESLWVAAQTICLGQYVTPGLVASQTQITALARMLTARERVDQHPLMHGWRGECLGKPLMEFLGGNTELHVRMDGQGLFTEMRSKPVTPTNTTLREH